MISAVDDLESLELAMNAALGGHALPIRIELNPEYRYPQHRQPDPRRPLPTPNDGRPTDPEVLAEVQRLVAEFAARFEAERGEAPRWEPGCSEAQIAEAEARLGVRLPEDLRAFYRVVRDDVHESRVWQELIESGWKPRDLAGVELRGPRTQAEQDLFRQAFEQA